MKFAWIDTQCRHYPLSALCEVLGVSVNALGGAAGAGIASIAAGNLNKMSDAIAGSEATGSADMNQALGNIVANAIATSAGAAVGGNAGAFSGYNVDRLL